MEWLPSSVTVTLITLLAIALPGVGAWYLGKSLRLRDYTWKFFLVFFCVAAAILVLIFDQPRMGIDLVGGVNMVFEIEEGSKKEDFQLERDLIGPLRRRIDPSGLQELTLREAGADQIEVIMPGGDEAQAEALAVKLTRQGVLTFQIVANTTQNRDIIERGYQTRPNGVKKLEALDGSGKILAQWVTVGKDADGNYRYRRASDEFQNLQEPQRSIGVYQNEKGELEVLLLVPDETTRVTGEMLTKAEPSVSEQGGWQINFGFNAQGSYRFGTLTGQNVNRDMAVVMNEQVDQVANIEERIDGEGRISGNFKKDEVDDRIRTLKAGSLGAKLNPEPVKRQVLGATLGEDAITRAAWALGISIVLVLAFMAWYYRFAGFVACGALILNLLFVVAVMFLVDAVFTLPGLAGLVLTVGMAIDANVLIFERLREESDRGASLKMAIRNGYQKATTTIVDANITTLITATVLYVIGTDQVKGFAITLWFGVAFSMFTAIFCTRVVFDVAEKKRWLRKLSMMRLLSKTNIDFLGRRNQAAIASVAVIALGLLALFSRGEDALDIDFTGGSSVQVVFQEPRTIGDVRSAVSEQVPDAQVKSIYSGEETSFLANETTEFIIETRGQDIEEFQSQLASAFEGDLVYNNLKWDELKTIGKAKPKEPSKPEVSDPKDFQDADDTEKQSLLLPGISHQFGLLAANPLATAAYGLVQDEPEEKKQEATKTEAPESDAPMSEEPMASQPMEPTPTPPTEEKPAEDSSKMPKQEPTDEGSTDAVAEDPNDPYAGGTETMLHFDQPVTREWLEQELLAHNEELGFAPTSEWFQLINEDTGADGIDVGAKNWTLRMKTSASQSETVLAKIRSDVSTEPYFPFSNNIGAKVAGGSRVNALQAIFVSLLFIVGYIWIRFHRVMYGLAAVVALVHDVLLMLGALAATYYFKIDLAVVAAFLTIIGYSLNDTIVVFDRIREVRGKSPRLTADMMNVSVNQTLSRTLLTALTTLIVVVILYGASVDSVQAFAFSLVVGVIVGTYSSIFIACPVLVWLKEADAQITSSLAKDEPSNSAEKASANA